MFHISSTVAIPLSLAHKAAEDNSRQALQATWYDAEVLYSSWPRCVSDQRPWQSSMTASWAKSACSMTFKMIQKSSLAQKTQLGKLIPGFLMIFDPQLSHFVSRNQRPAPQAVKIVIVSRAGQSVERSSGSSQAGQRCVTALCHSSFFCS